MTAGTLQPRNCLLKALDQQALDRLLPQLAPMTYAIGDMLAEVESGLSHVYFPENGVISVLSVYANGDAIEMMTIGREGVG